MKKEQNNTLQNIIKKLPGFKVPDIIWNRINKELSNREDIVKKLIEMPVKKAPDNIWPQIEEKLNYRNQKIKYLKNTKILKIAASITILISLSFGGLYFYNHSKQKDLSYSVEIIDDSLYDIQIELKTNGYEKLKVNCKKSPEICQSPLFIELNSQLKEIKTEQEKLKNEIKNQSNPELLKYYFRLENEKARLNKSLIKMFNES